MEKNIKYHLGSASLRFILTDQRNKLKIHLSAAKSFEMNDEMIHYLENKPELEVHISTK
jgi:hypothetical protein